jgi:hypothetical protein
MFHDIAFRGSAELEVQSSSPYKRAGKRNLQAGMGRVLMGKCSGVNQIGIVTCRLAWGLPVS